MVRTWHAPQVPSIVRELRADKPRGAAQNNEKFIVKFREALLVSLL